MTLSPLMLLVPVLWTLGASSAQAAGPREVIRTAADAVTDILADPDLDERQKSEKAEGVVERHLDTRTVSQLVLARAWRKLEENQRDDFVGEFRRYLVTTYWNQVNGLDISEIRIDGDREEARGDWTVETTVASERFGDTTVDYRLRRQTGADGGPGEWKIIDIVVEDVSLISNFRSQFKEILSDHSFAELMDMLREKNAARVGADDP